MIVQMYEALSYRGRGVPAKHDVSQLQERVVRKSSLLAAFRRIPRRRPSLLGRAFQDSIQACLLVWVFIITLSEL